jgi:hypothetical protein
MVPRKIVVAQINGSPYLRLIHAAEALTDTDFRLDSEPIVQKLATFLDAEKPTKVLSPYSHEKGTTSPLRKIFVMGVSTKFPPKIMTEHFSSQASVMLCHCQPNRFSAPAG